MCLQAGDLSSESSLRADDSANTDTPGLRSKRRAC